MKASVSQNRTRRAVSARKSSYQHWIRAMWVNSALVHGASGSRPISVYGRPYSGFQASPTSSASERASVVFPVDSAPSRQIRLTSPCTGAAYGIARIRTPCTGGHRCE